MIKKLIIHIGMHKTGSSSIQESFHKNLNIDSMLPQKVKTTFFKS